MRPRGIYMRGLTKVLAMGIALSFMVGAFALAPAKGGNVESDWMVDVGGSVPSSVTFQDVGWTPDGRYAMFVGYDGTALRGCAYTYDSQTGSWTEDTPNTAGSLDLKHLRAVEWDPVHSQFMAVGTTTSAGSYFLIPTNGLIYHYVDAVNLNNAELYDLGMGAGSEMFACGVDMAGYATLLSIDLSTMSVWAVRAGTATPASIWAGLEYHAGSNAVYLAGSYVSGSTFSTLDYLAIGVGTYNFAPATGLECALTDLIVDTAKGNLVVTASTRGTGVPALFYANLPLVSTWMPIANPPQITNFNGLDMGYNNALIVVGSDSTNGVIYDVAWNGAYQATRRTDDSLLSAHPLFAVACRPTGVPMALTAGSAFKYSYMAVDGGITVNTVYPHIDGFDMYLRSTATNVLNTNVDVDPGTSANYYVIQISGYYNAAGGANDIDQIDVWLWWDNGATATDNSGLIGGALGPNRGVQFRWTSGGGFVIQTGTVTNEWQIRVGDSTMTPAGNTFTARFAFEMNEQVRAALGPFTEPSFPGNQRYDPDADGPESEEQSTVNALNNADTWDIRVVVSDMAHSASSAPSYDEFGVYMFTSMTSGGLPGGGYISGSGAPNTPNVPLGPVGDWTFSANTGYDLYVHISDLTDGVNPIAATNIELQGGEIGAFTNFLGAGVANAQYLLGNVLPAPGVGNNEGPRDFDVTTTTTNGAADGTGGGQAVTWRCDIPAVPESSYSGTITYVLEHDP
jgi:hypothetical protein